MGLPGLVCADTEGQAAGGGIVTTWEGWRAGHPRQREQDSRQGQTRGQQCERITQPKRYAAISPAAGGHSGRCAAQWGCNMANNPVTAFREALASAGVMLAASVQIVPDGKLHRARALDDKQGQRTAWYRLHLDAPIAGAGGDWRKGISARWCSKRLQSLTAKERAELAARILRERAEAQAEQEARYRNASERAARIWAQAAPADAMHPYLQRKQIGPGISRQSGSALVLPVVDFAGALHGLQFIQPDGQKRFISGMAKAGHFIPSGGTPSPDRPLWIAEGHATACTLSTLQPGVVAIAACDAGNLLSVATEARKRWPGIDLVVCPDFDVIGLQKGQEAAEKARARIMKPDRLPSDLPAWVSDWNDWRQFRRQGVRS